MNAMLNAIGGGVSLLARSAGHILGMGLVFAMPFLALFLAFILSYGPPSMYAGVANVTWGLGIALAVGLAHATGLLDRFSLPSPATRVLDWFTNRPAVARLARSASGTDAGDVPAPRYIDAAALAARLRARVIGQDGVIDELAVLLRNRFAQEDREGPEAKVLFAGPPGVGKTELAKRLADELERPFLFFDMSQLANENGTNTLFGSPKGYMGSDTFGELTGGLRDKPDAIVLLDEIEKAHPSATTNFLTAFNDGFVTERSNGQKVSTVNALFVATTNAAADEIAALAAGLDDRDELRVAVTDALKRAGFKPELLSRIDRVFSFSNLAPADMARLVVIKIGAIAKRYGLALAPDGVSYDAIAHVVERSRTLQSAGGVREVDRALEELLAEPFINAKRHGARTVTVALGANGFDVETTT